MLSIVIPSYKDPYLHKTIDSLLEAPETDIEILPILDGYIPKKPICDDPRVHPIPLAENVGMREAINIGVQNAKGNYLMRTDEHCKFGKGYARILLEAIEDNWIVTPRRYTLDVEKWEVMGKPYDHEKLVINKRHNKFAGVRWTSRDEMRRDVMIDEKTAMQGSCWVMPKPWWDKVIVRLQSEGYGTLYQDSVEMCFKTWRVGGKLMLNKNTWYAHKHRKFNRTHQYSTSRARKCFDYSLATWMDDYKNIVVPKKRRLDEQARVSN
jgi:GT2 family glycosyltransferase